jgi:hypothetical protein
MSVDEFRDALLTVLERIAVALETANANNPLEAINRALGEAPLSAEGRRVLADVLPAIGVPDDERWRLR